MLAACSTPQPQETGSRRVDGTSGVGLSTERRRRRALTCDVGRRLSAREAGAVPCTQSVLAQILKNWYLNRIPNTC